MLGDSITLTLLGKKWGDAIPYIQVLAFFGLTNVISAVAVSALIAFNKPDILTKVMIARTVLRVTALGLGLYFWGTMGMVWGVLIVGFLGLLILTFVQNRLGILPFRPLVGLTWRLIFSTFIMAIGLYPLHMCDILIFQMPLILRLLLEVLSVAMLYGISLLTLWYFFS
ncbi:MAG: polysaccharide biosynthesis C-terminal domain-containing protein, partial [Dehalococcoidia bacterium]